MFGVYVLFSLFAAIYLARKTDQPLLAFVFLFWLLASPTLTEQFRLYVPGLPFDLRINRQLFFFLSAFIFFALLRRYPIKWHSNRLYLFEKVLLVYLGLVFLSLIYNQNSIEFKVIFSVSWEIITFFLFYYVSKRYIRHQLYQKIFTAIILMGVVTSLVSIIQFFVANDFYRIDPGQTRPAFGGLLRSTGVFQNEYEQGYFLIVAIFILLAHRNIRFRRPLIGMFVIGLVLAFHRVDMAILFIVFSFYFVWFKPKFFALFLSAGLLAAAFLGTLYIGYEDNIKNSSVVKERLSQDSGGRWKQFSAVINNMPNTLMGFGDYQNRDYRRLMIRNGNYISFVDEDGEWDKKPLTVHNGYLAVGAKYGPLAMIVFILFMINLLIQFKKLGWKERPESFVPFIMIVIWSLANMTNGIEHFRTHFVLLLGIICGSYIGLYPTYFAQRQKARLS